MGCSEELWVSVYLTMVFSNKIKGLLIVLSVSVRLSVFVSDVVFAVCVGRARQQLIGSGGQSTQIKYLSKSTDTYNKILLQ